MGTVDIGASPIEMRVKLLRRVEHESRRKLSCPLTKAHVRFDVREAEGRKPPSMPNWQKRYCPLHAMGFLQESLHTASDSIRK